MIKNYQLIIPFNARWQDGCDYALQTIRILARTNQVVTMPMAHEETLWITLGRILSGQKVLTPWHKAWVFTPIVLLPLRRFSVIKNWNYALNIWLLKWVLLSTTPKIADYDAAKQLIWFFEPHYSAVWLKLFANWRVVYDCVDFWVGFPGKIAQQHSMLVKKADYIAVNSRALLAAIKPLRSDVKEVPLGFAARDFASLATPKPARKYQLARDSRQQKIFGFVGQIGNRFDFKWLKKVVAAFPQHKFVFVGATWIWQELDGSLFAKKLAELQKQPNCVFLPSVEKKIIPQYIHQFDFGLIPYDTNQIFNKNCHPMKLYEYWYFGKPVVSTHITELLKYGDLLAATNHASNAIAWIKHILQKGQSRVVQRQLHTIAIQNSWEEKLEAISTLIAPYNQK